jgi:hypothetical protein
MVVQDGKIVSFEVPRKAGERSDYFGRMQFKKHFFVCPNNFVYFPFNRQRCRICK